jgi:hypothetical protein
MTTERFNQLVTERTESPKSALYKLIKGLDISRNIMNKNFLELQDHLDKHGKLAANQSFITFNPEHKIELHEYMDELQRVLHNYVSSTQSLVEHQRRHYAALHEEKKSFPEYQNEINCRFVNDPLSNFIKQLRHYFSHYGTPSLASTRVFDDIAKELSILLVIKTDVLLNGCYKWNAPAKKYLEQLTEEVNISEIISAYHNHVNDFQQWYENQQNEIFYEEIGYIEGLETEIRKIGLDSIFTILSTAKSFKWANIEQGVLRYLPYNEVKAYCELKTKSERVDKLIQSASKITTIPSIVMAIIVTFKDDYVL